MPRWLEILLTLVVFAALMGVVSWVVNASVPGVGAWLSARVGEAGIWTGIIIFWLAAGLYAWRGHRPKPGSAGNLDGR